MQVTDANGCIYATTFIVQLEGKYQYSISNWPNFIFSEKLTLRAFNVGLSAGLGVVAAIGISLGIFALIMMVKFRQSVSKVGGFYSFVITSGVCISL